MLNSVKTVQNTMTICLRIYEDVLESENIHIIEKETNFYVLLVRPRNEDSYSIKINSILAGVSIPSYMFRIKWPDDYQLYYPYSSKYIDFNGECSCGILFLSVNKRYYKKYYGVKKL